jgi:small subunit ribosomal protein S7
MLRTVPRTYRLGCLVANFEVLTFNRHALPICRQYADKKTPRTPRRTKKTAPPISDYIASQEPPTDPDIPPDKLPHQTEEDIAMEKIFGDKQSGGTGEVPEGVPVQEVFNNDPKAMEKAPKVVKDEDSYIVVDNAETAHGESGNEVVRGHSGMPHVNEESIAYERIISGEDASGETDSLLNDNSLSNAVPIEEVIGDGQKPAVMDESSENDEPPSGGQTLPENGTADTESVGIHQDTVNPDSIPELILPRRSNRRPGSQKMKQTATESVNPLAAHQLDESNIDLSAWEVTERGGQDAQTALDPEDWTDTQRGTWEIKEEEDEMTESRLRKIPALEELREEWRKIQVPEVHGKPIPDFDLKLPRSDELIPSRWDYFYPPPPTPLSLDSALAKDRQRRSGATSTDQVYDPFGSKVRHRKWPWIYNRDQLIDKCTNLLMRDGKKANAEKVLQQVFLKVLEHYPLQHPVTVVADAIDRNAPLVKNITHRVVTVLKVTPSPLFEAQRIRIGWKSLIKAAEKGLSSEGDFAERLAKEVIKVMEGRGAGLPNRIAEHRKAMLNKLNIRLPARK